MMHQQQNGDFFLKETWKIGENIRSISSKYENLKERVEHSIIENKTMTEIVTKVIILHSKTQTRKQDDQERELDTESMKSEYHSCHNNLLFDGS